MGSPTSWRPSTADYPPKCNGSQMADCEGGATWVMSGLCGSMYNKYFLRLNDSCGCWQGWNDGQELVYSNKQHRKQPIKVLSLKRVPYWWGRRVETAVEQWSDEDAKRIRNELRRVASPRSVAIGRTRKQLERVARRSQLGSLCKCDISHLTWG